MRWVLEQAEQGDRSALLALEMLLDATPEVWRAYGDLARVAEDAWVELVAGPNVLLMESLRRKLAELKSELLSDPVASPLEQLLVERVGAGWLQTAYAGAAAAQAREKPLDLAQLEQQQRRQERAQKGYLAAIRTLATVRKLLAADVRLADRRESSRRSSRAKASSRSAGKAAGSNPWEGPGFDPAGHEGHRVTIPQGKATIPESWRP
jgi:hypothetical protein